MYATEYTWIRVPTKVTRRTKVIDSGSIRRPASTLKEPARIQVPSPRSLTRSPAGWPSMAIQSTRATRNDEPGAATPSQWPQRSPRRPTSSSTAAPTSGSATSSQAIPKTPSAGTASAAACATDPASAVITRSSAPQEVDVVDRCGAAGAVDRHDDRQPDDHLGGCHHHDEERDHLTGEVAVDPGEGHEDEVRCVEHQLHAHEHDDRVAPHQHRQRTDGEQQRREHQVVGQVHRTGSSPVIAGGVAGTSPIWACTSATERSCPRIRSTRDTDCSSGRPSAPSAATSIALLRA